MARKNTFPIGSRLEWVNNFNQDLKAFDRYCTDTIGLNATQTRILFHAALFPHTPIGNIANRLKLKASTTTAAYDGLEAKGLVLRESTGDDKRNVFVQATEKGETVSLGYLNALSCVFNEYVNHFTEEQINEIQRILSESRINESENYAEALIALCERERTQRLDIEDQSFDLDEQVLLIICFENICSYLARANSLDRTTGLTPNEARALRSTAMFNKPISIKDITSFISIRPNVATVAITGLTEKELIERTTDKKDKRSASITLSEKGSQYIKDTTSEFNKLFDSSFPSAAKSKIHLPVF